MSKLLFDLAGKAADGVFTVTPLLDPADPKNADNAAMKLYTQQITKKFPSKTATTDPHEGIIAYGWTTAALLVKTLEGAKALNRASVMESARALTDLSGVGLQLTDSKWNTNANDWFIGETYQFIKWDATAGHSVAVGPLTTRVHANGIEQHGCLVERRVGDEDVLVDLALDLEPRRLHADERIGHQVVTATAVEDDGEAAVLVRFGGARRLIDERRRGDVDVLHGLFIGPHDAAASQ